MRYFFYFFIWFIYLPLIRLLALLLYWNQKLENRERFEKKNKFEYMAQTFKDKSVVADICFEFSSEGEFQQVAPMINDALEAGQKVELVFFSPSVEKTVMKLAAQYPTQIRYLRYPLVRFFPFISRRSFTHWVTARTLVLVRYDFFPEFLLWGLHPDHQLMILWCTFKKERLLGRDLSWWKRAFLKHSKSIIYATKEDQRFAHSAGLSGEVYDFRIEQIRRRVTNRLAKFHDSFPLYPELQQIMTSYRVEKKLIMGNVWPNDLFLLKDMPSDFMLMIVPHDLSEKVLIEFRSALSSLNYSYVEVNEHTERIGSANCILLSQKGLLCELYTDFENAYVGGGFNGSIHSVLEPFVSGSKKISCGPQHHRSTEYDLVRERGHISEVNTPEQFKLWLNSPKQSGDNGKMNEMFLSYEKIKEQVIGC